MTALEYQLGKRVARGGSGVVYRATLSDGRTVAVKRLAAKYRDDRLLREAHVLASLDHPNIVKFFGVAQRKDDLELVMEWVGPKLELLRRTGELPIGAARHIIVELLSALDYLHGQKKLNHRDLSPRNVLLGEDGAVKLADFGLARKENAPRSTSVLKGSPPYMSPEQASTGKVDARSDLFAIGVVFYELLTGRLPFQSSSELANCPLITPVSALRPAVPRKLDRIIARLLQYDRAKRYSSAQEVLDELGDSPDERAIGRADLALLMRERGLIRGPSKAGQRIAGMAIVAAAGLLVVAGVNPYESARPATTAQTAASEFELSSERQEPRLDSQPVDDTTCVVSTDSVPAPDEVLPTSMHQDGVSPVTHARPTARKKRASQRTAPATETTAASPAEAKTPAPQPQPRNPGGSYGFQRPMGGSFDVSGTDNSVK